MGDFVKINKAQFESCGLSEYQKIIEIRWIELKWL